MIKDNRINSVIALEHLQWTALNSPQTRTKQRLVRIISQNLHQQRLNQINK